MSDKNKNTNTQLYNFKVSTTSGLSLFRTRSTAGLSANLHEFATLAQHRSMVYNVALYHCSCAQCRLHTDRQNVMHMSPLSITTGRLKNDIDKSHLYMTRAHCPRQRQYVDNIDITRTSPDDIYSTSSDFRILPHDGHTGRERAVYREDNTFCLGW